MKPTPLDLEYVVMKMKTDELTETLLTDLRPYIHKLNLQGFSGMFVIDMPDANFDARVVNGRVEFNYRYFSERAKRALQGDAIAYSDLLNTFHHELCHIDINNKMPFLSRTLIDEEIFPLGIAFRFTREFLACLGSTETMSADGLKEQIAKGTEDINMLSRKRDIKNYCDIVCDIAYLIGNCIHSPCGYFASVCNAIDDDMLVVLAQRFLSVMSKIEHKIPFEAEEDILPIRDTILTGWQHFNKSGG